MVYKYLYCGPIPLHTFGSSSEACFCVIISHKPEPKKMTAVAFVSHHASRIHRDSSRSYPPAAPIFITKSHQESGTWLTNQARATPKVSDAHFLSSERTAVKQ
jgi:hypothetical protein